VFTIDYQLGLFIHEHIGVYIGVGVGAAGQNLATFLHQRYSLVFGLVVSWELGVMAEWNHSKIYQKIGAKTLII
jgi:hypothetical protein